MKFYFFIIAILITSTIDIKLKTDKRSIDAKEEFTEIGDSINQLKETIKEKRQGYEKTIDSLDKTLKDFMEGIHTLTKTVKQEINNATDELSKITKPTKEQESEILQQNIKKEIKEDKEILSNDEKKKDAIEKLMKSPYGELSDDEKKEIINKVIEEKIQENKDEMENAKNMIKEAKEKVDSDAKDKISELIPNLSEKQIETIINQNAEKEKI